MEREIREGEHDDHRINRTALMSRITKAERTIQIEYQFEVKIDTHLNNSTSNSLPAFLTSHSYAKYRSTYYTCCTYVCTSSL